MAVDLKQFSDGISSSIIRSKKDFLDSVDKGFSGAFQSLTNSAVYNYTSVYKAPLEQTLLQPTEINLSTLEFILPDKPATLTDEMYVHIKPSDYTKHVFKEARLDSMQTIMDTFIQSFTKTKGDDTGIAINRLTDSMYNLGYELDKDDTIIELASLANRWCADGYLMVPDAMVYDSSLVIAGLDKKRTSATQDVFNKIGNLLQQNMQWGFENAIAIEHIHADFTLQFVDAIKMTVKTAVECYIAEIDKRGKDLEVQLKKLEMALKVNKRDYAKDKSILTIKEQDVMSRFSAEYKLFIDQQKALADLTSEKIKQATNVATGYQAIVQTYSNLFSGVSLETNKIK